jgi:hypothetical protein
MMEKKMILGDAQANREKFEADANHFFVPFGDASELVNIIDRAKNAS